jgi:hypothetical protein
VPGSASIEFRANQILDNVTRIGDISLRGNDVELVISRRPKTAIGNDGFYFGARSVLNRFKVNCGGCWH